jgi:hypothetical protein
MRTIEEFAEALVQRYRGQLTPSTAGSIVADDLAAGEYEVAAISVVELGPVSRQEIDELEQLAATFEYSRDREIAERVIAKRRKQLAA